MSIFVSIASFCDPLLEFTINQAISNAKNPSDIFFGVIEQNHSEKALKFTSKNIRYVLIDPAHSKGACWARSLAMSLYNDEDWFFQIDSHTDFDQDWDKTLIDQFNLLSPSSSNLVISSYPNAFIIEEGKPVKKPVTKGVLAHILKKDHQFKEDDYALSFEAHPFDSLVAIKGFHLGAGCLFTKGEYVQRFPYDPYLYFMGEEQTLAARLFTNGWDIFHMPAMPVYHLYNNKDNKQPPRQLHWSSDIEINRSVPWSTLQRRSTKRIIDLFKHDQRLGVYGLGTIRSLHDYAQFSGINYITRQIDKKAYVGYWKLPDVT